MNEAKSALTRYFEANPRMVPDIGCYIGAGWEPAVLHALELMQALSEETGVWVQPRQIKEKFGSLRFYAQVHATDKEAEEEDEADIPVVSSELLESVRQRLGAIVRQAEEATALLCESCGMPEEKMSNLGGYICRRCPACIAVREAGTNR